MNLTGPTLFETARLTRGRRLAVYAIAGGVWLTGAAWLVLHHFLQRQGPFGSEALPLEWWSLAAHGMFAFASVWLLGLLWGVHFGAAWRSLRRRSSGIALLAVAIWLIASGYLLYYIGGDGTRSIVAFIHWAAGLAAPIPFVLHRFFARH